MWDIWERRGVGWTRVRKKARCEVTSQFLCVHKQLGLLERIRTGSRDRGGRRMEATLGKYVATCVEVLPSSPQILGGRGPLPFLTCNK